MQLKSSMHLSFIDSGVLIAAARGNSPRSTLALNLLADAKRTFGSSIFIKLEVLPKAVCYQQAIETEFYQSFFEQVTAWSTDLNSVSQSAYQLACTYGLSGLDALNIAAALVLQADEFVTTEKPTKPMYRVPGLQFVKI